MNITIKSADIGGTIDAIPSKSMAHRYLICAALSDNKTVIECSQTSKDIEATAECLNNLGAKCNRTSKGYEVTPIIYRNKTKENAVIDCGESGSTMRFLLPIAGALGIKTDIYSRGRLPERPLSPLYEEMQKHGCILSKQGVVPFKVDGKLSSGEYILDAGVSSQFISGLLFALPMLHGDSVIKLQGSVESKSYIYMTMQALKMFGIEVNFLENIKEDSFTKECKDNTCSIIKIKGDQIYHSTGDVLVEGDWSNIAFWICAGAIGNKEVKCTNIKADSLQGDKKVVDIVKNFGAKITKNDNAVIVKKDSLTAITIDASNIPDLIPVLSVVAAVSKGTTTVINAARLRIKECDRLSVIAETLNALSAEVIEKEDKLIIIGKDRLKGGVVNSFNDHRIVMMATIASIVCDGEVTITDAHAVSKSYPTFFEDFVKLGGVIEEK